MSDMRLQGAPVTRFIAISANADGEPWARVIDQCITLGLAPVLVPFGLIVSKLTGRPVIFWERTLGKTLPTLMRLGRARPK